MKSKKQHRLDALGHPAQTQSTCPVIEITEPATGHTTTHVLNHLVNLTPDDAALILANLRCAGLTARWLTGELHSLA